MARKKSEMEDSVPAQVIAGPIEEYCTKPEFDADGVQVSAGILHNGKEEIDPVPFAPGVKFPSYDPLDELIRRYVRRELSHIAAQDDFETFEEADDFDIEDDPLDALTEYEKVFDVSPPPAPSPTAPAVPQTVAGATVSTPSGNSPGVVEGGAAAASQPKPPAVAPSDPA